MDNKIGMRSEIMIKEYKTLLKSREAEIVIEKSRFIGYCAPVSSEDEALKFIEKIKAKHSDALIMSQPIVLGWKYHSKI